MWRRFTALVRNAGKALRWSRRKHSFPAKERRQWIRFRSHLDATCDLVVEDEQYKLWARIHDVSRGGVRLLVPQYYEAGSLLQLVLPKDMDEQPERLLVCVVHSDRAPEEDWLAGCSFIRELKNEELQAFL